MNIFSYVLKLAPFIEKRLILEDISNSIGELKQSTLPTYKSAATALAKHQFKDTDLQKMIKQFDRDNRTGIKGNLITVIYEVAKRIEDNAEHLTKLTDLVFSNDVMASGITYKKANFLQYIEAISFFQRYARKLLLYVYTVETAFVTVGPDTINGHMTAGDIKWLKDNLLSFNAILEPLAMKSVQIEAAVGNIPDIIVSEENGSVIQSTQGNKVDPFRMNFIPARFNPIFSIRKHFAEWQDMRYKAAMAERKALEFRLLHLQNKMDGKNDPAIEEQIEYSLGRLEKLNYKIQRYEDDL